MVKYISQPQLFGQMLKLAVEFQDGILTTKTDKSYRVVWSTIRYKKQVDTNAHLKYIRHWKLFGAKIVYVKAYTINKGFKVESKASAWFVLRKKK